MSLEHAQQKAKKPCAGCGLLRLAIGTPLAAMLGWIAYSRLFVSHDLPLPPAVSGDRKTLTGRAGTLSYYVAGAAEHPPLLLIHSVNAAASAYEIRPIYEHFRHTRRVYALDLPGFGFSERSKRDYTIRLYTDAILDMLEVINRDVGNVPVDALAFSLGCEFMARAANEQPERFRSLAMIAPTGFRKGENLRGTPGSNRGNLRTLKTFLVPFWRQAFFDLLTTRPMLHFFLKRVFSEYVPVDEDLLSYDYLTTHQPGAFYAPYAFVSGMLFGADIDRVYDEVSQPVWLAYGVLGAFGNVDTKKAAKRSTWKLQAFPTGGMPHIEKTAAFCEDYQHFLEHGK